MNKPYFQNEFIYKLLDWHDSENKRTMPWKGEKDPYKIWLSEIILQQTRVAQGLAYYERFVSAFPTIQALASAPDTEVYKLWEGLGYYSRCRNLIATAREVAAQGHFPSSYETLLQLKGVGPYTAAAIASFAFGLPHAVVDGNVYRVLSRYFGESVPIDSTKGKQLFNELATKLLYQPEPAKYNQAIMDFGAIVCTPQQPACEACPLQYRCIAYQKGKVDLLPVKEKVMVIKHRWFYYFVFLYQGHVMVRQRLGKDIWQNLHEFYLIESSKRQQLTRPQVIKLLHQIEIKDFSLLEIIQEHKQQLTHQSLVIQLAIVRVHEHPKTLNEFSLIDPGKMDDIAFPKTLKAFVPHIQSLVQSAG
ncbi:A/G-specific adenine glycosylase [Aridibaculum aurantiacum]|uniref:A/G-specific adenine glycosylase n=1 Tax=Aridibaculum aurantiacum TaxID=2810307 RepID=UPI001A95A6A0|nr:A/G-specific adenine glycosylase [Aridibaculum aurantiacum]